MCKETPIVQIFQVDAQADTHIVRIVYGRCAEKLSEYTSLR